MRKDVKLVSSGAGSVAWVLPAAQKALDGELDGAEPFPQAFFEGYDDVRTPLSANVQAFLLGEKSALQALQDTEKQAELALK